MTTHAERKLLPYAPPQLYQLVGDVAKYPSFLPWCVAAKIRSRDGNDMIADLTIGFGPFRESFTSHVTFTPPDATGVCMIQAEYQDGPFKYLHNRWIFTPQGQGCLVDFFVDFEFQNQLLQKAIGAVFTEAVRMMVNAFLKRARQVFGPPKFVATKLAGESQAGA